MLKLGIHKSNELVNLLVRGNFVHITMVQGQSILKEPIRKIFPTYAIENNSFYFTAHVN